MDIAAALDDLSDVNAATPDDEDGLTWDSGTTKWIAAPGGGGGGTQQVLLIYSVPGTLETSVGAAQPMLPFACTIVGCRARVGTAPTGASAIFDVHKDGTTIYTTQG